MVDDVAFTIFPQPLWEMSRGDGQTTFNDPLDACPTLNADIPAGDLEWALRELVEQRVTAEMKTAARTIKYK
jgi:hypothetical protein